MKQTNTLGLSLIEMVITLAIISLLLGLGCMGFYTLQNSQKNQCLTMRIFHTLAYARSEAIKRNQIIGVCGSSDFHHCSSDWSNGYMVFTMNNNKPSPLNILRIQNHNGQPIHSNKQTVIKYSGDGKCLSRCTIFIGNQQKIVIYDSGRSRIESIQ